MSLPFKNAVAKITRWLVACFLYTTMLPVFGAEPGREMLRGHVPAAVNGQVPRGNVPKSNHLSLAIGLPLHNQAELDLLLAQLYDPNSTNYHKFLEPEEFTARFGPSEADYVAVRKFAEANGMRVSGTHPNRMVLDVEGSVSNVEQAFHTTLRTYKHPREARNFYAPDIEPSVPTNLPVVDMWGLSDFGPPRPLAHAVPQVTASPLNYNGTGPGGSYQGKDFRNAYAPGSPLNGAGQIVAMAEFDGYYQNDITTYEAQCGYTNVLLTNVLVNSVTGLPGYSGLANAVAEVSLDIELAIAMAPGMTKMMVYEGSNPYDVFNKILTDNKAKQISCSWAFGTGPTSTWKSRPVNSTLDSILSQMVAQGQAFFQASGDSDAYTGNEALSTTAGPVPVDSIYVTSVGGTTLNMSAGGAAWSSETVWNWGGNVGGGGGISPNYNIPSWQASVSMAANSGSTTKRNIPDVALTADAVHVVHDNGASGSFGGTSCAAPLWAGFCALLNQRAIGSGSTNMGFLNPALYALAARTNYASCFHDITVGNNIGTNTPGLFNAVTNYDLATGLGTPNGTNLINALAPSRALFFVVQPAGQNAPNGTNVTLSATLDGQTPIVYSWFVNGTNLVAGGNVSGTTNNLLSLTSVTTNNSGNYTLVASNSFGSVTSSVAGLNIGFPPVISAPPTNLTLLSGSNAVFSSTASGSSSLIYQWRKGGTNLSNGAGISGATSNVLTLTGITTNSSGSYALFVTNAFGTVLSGSASLNVVLPPVITSSSIAGQFVECGGNITYTSAVSGTTPLYYQWSLDSSLVAGATNASLTVTNVHFPNHTIALTVSNLYASVSSNGTLTVHDTIAPALALNGANQMFVELGGSFTDPGAMATDVCAGAVSINVSGTVNAGVVGTNALVYKAGDGNGNTNTLVRAVIVRDTTPPTIAWSFTNLVLVADANCSATMSDVTGTNFILANDLSGALTISQTPTNYATLPLGTNTVILTVKDASSNASYSTNTVVVIDQTPPVITLSGSNPMFSELGGVITDPGAMANDTCSGAVAVSVSGLVDTSVIGTNLLVYTSEDGHGNTNTASRTVIVRDTKPPTILWSFTNLTLAANTNCVAEIPDLTGTNFILVADLSGPLSISQSPTNGAILPMGTNFVVLSVADIFDNTANSTNVIVVLDQSTPQILTQPQSRTNLVDTVANFSVTGNACSPLSYQWYFGPTALTNQTNSTLTIYSAAASDAGNYSVVINSEGGSTNSAVASLNVDLIATSLALNSSNNPSGFGDAVNFIASIFPTGAGGSVQFLTNGFAFDVEPVLTWQSISTNLASLPRGTNQITAIYSGDANHYPSTNTLAQIVTNHPPAAIAAAYQRKAGAELDIVVSNLATNWTDLDGDVISLVDFSNSTNGVTLTNISGTLVYLNTNDVPDEFTCTISDGWGGTNFQTVSITIAPPVSTVPNISSVSASADGSVNLNLAGAPGYTYILEATADIFPYPSWSPVATNTLGTNGVWQFNDVQATNYSQRFYRLKLSQ